MREALDSILSGIIDTQTHGVLERKRMNELRGFGQELYSEAKSKLLGGTLEERGTATGIRLVSHTEVISPPVMLTFQHNYLTPGGDRTLDVTAKVHLESIHSLMFPDQQQKSGIAFIADFHEPYGEWQIFGVAEDGDVINHEGSFASYDEIVQAKAIAQALPTPSS